MKWDRKQIVGLIVMVLVTAIAVSGIALWMRNDRLEQLQNEALAELERNAGQYDEQSIVLYQTSKAKAEELAKLYGAKLRITENGRFATLTLPEGTTIRDVYALEKSKQYIDEMAADYQVSVSELTDEEGSGERLPQRPQYSVSDADYELQTYLDYLNMGEVWNYYTGSGVTVAVIDTGIDTDHPEFAGRISEYSYNATEDKIVKDYNDWSLIKDEQGHGTAVTGVIAATMNSGNVVGIAPDVEIIVIKAECDEKGNFYRTSDLLFGIYYAIERDVNVVNMSFGAYGSPNPFAEATQLAYDSDIICVAAAGNDSTSSLCWPAADKNVIGVGALDSWILAEYSNFGENTDVMAPGTTYTTYMGGTYGIKTGTSFACPIVAGAIALLLQNNPYTTFEDVTEVLYASSYDLGDLGSDWYYGFGALDVSALLLEERGKIAYEMLTDELENMEGLFIQGHTLQELPEPERLYAVFDGWYYDDTLTQEYNYYADKFYGDEITLYAKWVNEDDGVPYTYVILDDGTVEIRSYTGHRRFITIPEKIEGRVVTSIGDYAFANQARIREVLLPSGLNHIGRYAFQNCPNLISMQIPENVTKIEVYAFSGAVRLATVAFLGNSKLTTIGDFAFEGCGNLRQIELPTSLQRINGSAFYGATALYRIHVQQGNAVFQSKEGVLYDQSGSTLVAFPAAWGSSYVLPEETTEIGSYACAYARLEQIDLSCVTTVGDAAFKNAALETLTIPDGVTSLGIEAFADTVQLQQLLIGRGLKFVSEGAFAGTLSLRTVTIPNGILNIEPAAFSGSGLQSVIFEENSRLHTIGAYAFYDCNIAQIDIPASVMDIGAKAFSGSFLGNPLVRVDFTEESVLRGIGAGAFAKCWLLQQIKLPESLESIGDFAFQESGLTNVTVPAKVTTLGDGAFTMCADLTAVTVAEGNTVYHDIDGVVYTLDNSIIHTYPAARDGAYYNLESDAKIVAPWAFAGAKHLITVILPEGLAQICEYGISHCENMEYIDIPDNVVQIGGYAFAMNWRMYAARFNETSKLPRLSYGAFAYCGITAFRVPANVSTMAQRVFEGSHNMRSITFAANSKLQSLSAYVFNGCENIQRITFEPGSALTSIQAHGLEGIDKLQYIDFGDAKLTNIDNFAFRFCESLSELNLPDTLTNIGRYAFYGCKRLSELTIPASVEHIGRYAFLAAGTPDLYFTAESLPKYLDENWDYDIKGYYLGVESVQENGDFKYAILPSGNIGILQYLGTAEQVDLTQVDLGGPITIIGGGAFAGSMVRSVALPETLTVIQAEAFRDTALESVTIPANVTFIGREAFAHTQIQTLTFADNAKLSVIEQYAFAGTKNLTAVTLPASVTTMGTGVFQGSGLQSVTFVQGIQLAEIPQKAFMGTKLTAVALPDSVTLVNHNAFNKVQTLRSVTFGNNEGIRLMSNAFYHTGLESLHIPANVTYIGEYCFVALSSLTEFTVDENNPNYKAEDGLLLSKDGRKLIAAPAGREGCLTVPLSVEEIGFGAFEESKLSEVLFHEDANILSLGCRAFFKAENITAITIPKSVVSIDYYAFAYCEKLREVVFADGCQLKGIYEGAFIGDLNLESITIPDSVVEISDFAFYGCSRITELPISDTHNLKGIYDYAFAYTGLSGEFTAPETLWDIGNYAFLGCRFTEITIPDANKLKLQIGLGAFADCDLVAEMTLPFVGTAYESGDLSWFSYIFGAGSYEASEVYVPESLKTVTITDGLTTIGIGGFANCTSIETIHVPHSVSALWNHAFYNTTAQYQLTNTVMTYWIYEDFPVIFKETWEGHFGYGVQGDVKLADGITQIRDLAFRACEKMETVTIPDSVTRIDSCAFLYCQGLRNATMGNGVTEIGYSAFEGCRSLTNITLSSGVTGIPRQTFKNCDQLKRIQIGNAATEIGEEAFSGCSSLTDITIGDHVTSIGKNAFFWCTSLKTVTIPDSVTDIAESAFYHCDALTDVTIGNGVTVIGDSAFEWCKKLTGVTLGNSVTAIGNYAFRYCESLSAITLPDTVTGIGESAFYRCNAMKRVINHSQLPLQLGSWDYGYIAYYADILKDANGNVTYAQSDWFETEDHFVFSYADDTYRLRAYIGDEQTVTLPSQINGSSYVISDFRGAKHVIIPEGMTKINYYAFYDCTELESVTLPGSITSIEESAFGGCRNLTSITLPEGLTSIGIRAFFGCEKLKNISIPQTVTHLGSNAFSGCTSLTEITLPNGATKIDGVFSGCSALAQVSIPDTVTSMNGAFFGCSSLKTVAIPGSVISMDSAFSGCVSLETVAIPDSVLRMTGAFSGCTSLTEIVVPAGVTDLSQTFYGCENLESVDLPAGVTSLFQTFYGCTKLKTVKMPEGVASLDGTFEGCSSLESIAIPDSVTTIKGKAFDGCGSLTDISLGKGLREIDYYVFDGCENLKRVDIADLSVWCGITFQSASSNPLYYGAELYINGLLAQNVVIPDTVTHIDKYTFYGCTSLESVVIPEGVTGIYHFAFGGCSNLRNVSIPASVINIYQTAFMDCTGLTNIVLPEDAHFRYMDGVLYDNPITKVYWVSPAVTHVTVADGVTDLHSAFMDCKNLKSVVLPDSMTDFIGAFSGCTNLTYVKLPDGITQISYGAFRDCTSLRSIVIPESVTAIDSFAFSGCTSLTDITIPAGVTELGEGVFSGCSSLTNVIIPDGVPQISKDAFRDCCSLTSIAIPGSVTGIGENAFRGCSGLTSIIIPDSVTDIGLWAFCGCSSLESATIGQGVTAIVGGMFENCTNLTKIVIPDSVTSIGYRAFSRCTGLTGVEIPGSITEIGEDAFSDCAALESVTLGDGLESIGNGAFYSCERLQAITIPTSVTDIGGWVFAGCENLIQVTNLSALPLQAGSMDYGSVAYSAYVVIDADGNKTYPGENWFETEDHFLFMYMDGEYILRGYLGDQEAVTLPLYVNDSAYRIEQFRGAKHVTLPDGMGQLGNGAFRGGILLESITIPDSLGYIGTYAFEGCYDIYDPAYLQYGMYVADGWLIDVDEDAEYLTNVEGIRGVAVDAYEGCHRLMDAVWGYCDLPSNVETVYITRITSATPWLYSTVTLKNVVICDTLSVDALNQCPGLFYQIAGVTIYVEELKANLQWDDNYPHWHNDNRVIYGDGWNYVNFYDAQGNRVASEIVKNAQIVRQPFIVLPENTEADVYTWLGWDLDGDGVADAIPATTMVDIHATAVFLHEHTHIYGQWYMDRSVTCTEDGTERRNCEYCDHYEQRTAYATGHIPGPEATCAGGQICVVCGITLADPKEHAYESVVVAPTCTQQGYTTHTCALCGDSYVDNYTDALGHSAVTDGAVAPTCTQSGLTEGSHCALCGEILVVQETVDALGHDYDLTDSKAPTCTEDGYNTYTCNHDGSHTYTETVEAIGHNYIGVVTAPNCTEDGYTTYTCEHCADTYTADVVAALGHSYEETVVEPTCTEEGSITHTCTTCGDTYTEKLEKLPHSYEDGVCQNCGASEVLLGDVNGDGNVNSRDARLLLRYLAGLVGEEDLNLAAANFNGDSSVNVRDARAILRYIAGLE